MSDAQDWKQHAEDLARKTRPWLERAWLEVRQTALDTWAQATRLYGYAAGRWRERNLDRQALAAREALGDAMFHAGQGDAKLRQAISEMDDRLRSIEAAKGSTTALKTERRGLCIRLAEGALAVSPPPPGVEGHYQAATAAFDALAAERASLALSRQNLWPADQPTLIRTIAGASTVALLLLLCTWWLTRDTEPVPPPPIPNPTPVEPDPQDPDPDPTPPDPTPPDPEPQPDPTPPSSDVPLPEIRAVDLFALKPQTEAGNQVIDALALGDLDAARAALEQMRNVGETDEKYTILESCLPLLENEIVDPFTLAAYSFDFDPNSTAFIANGAADPVDQTIFNLRAIGNRSPSVRPFIADSVRCTVSGALRRYVEGGGNVGLSDDILFSTRSHSETGGSGTVDHEHLCSNPAAREKFQGQRLWFVSREVEKLGIGFHVTGIWFKAIVFADEMDAASRERWDSIFIGLAVRFAADSRFESAVLVLVQAANLNQFQALVELGNEIDRSDKRKVTNLVIAFGYIMESWAILKRPLPTGDEFNNSALAELGRLLIEMGNPNEVDIAFACGKLTRAQFKN